MPLKILFIHQGLISFVKNDLEILQSAHHVRELRFRGVQDIPALISGVLWADLTFSWFGKLHAFFAVFFSKLLCKKAVVVAGGDDVAYQPDIKYGMFSFWWKRWCPLFVFKYADLIIPVSKFNEKETLINAKANPKKVKMIYHGFSDAFFKKDSDIEKENVVITIASASKETEVKKGLRLFIESAKLLSNIQFWLIGPSKDGALERLQRISSDNVRFTDGVYGQDLIGLCSKAKVYVQISIHESFGCSLAEAMLCECIPVVSRNAAIPEVVGDTGIYVDKLNPENVAEKIKYALSLPDDYGVKARERIVNNFSYENRKAKILEAVESFNHG